MTDRRYVIVPENGSDELRHYGVLGMKWGVRRAEKKGTTYTYKSMGQKKYTRKVNKLEKRKDKKLEKLDNSPESKIKEKKILSKHNSKMRVAKTKLETFKTRDRHRQEYAESTTVGRTIVKELILGPLGAGNYNRMRAAGSTRIAAAVKNNIITGSLSYPIRLIMTRDEEFRSARK